MKSFRRWPGWKTNTLLKLAKKADSRNEKEGMRILTLMSRMKRWFFPTGVRPRDLLLPVITLVLTLGVGLSSLRIFRMEESDAVFIDLAGRQRMLLQKYQQGLPWRKSDQEKSKEALKMLTETAHAFRYGGAIKFGGVPEWFGADPVSDPRIAENLDAQISLFNRISDLQRNATLITNPAILEDTSRVVDGTVELYVKVFRDRVHKALIANLVLTIALATLGLWLSWLIVERWYNMNQLIKANAAATQASAAKSQFLANMSHEIRTPLNAIIGMTEILQDGELSQEQRRFVDTLRRAGDTLLALINDILDLSKIEAGQLQLNRADTDLIELVEAVGEVVALRAQQKGVKLTCTVARAVPRSVILDGSCLRQVLMNLLGNAVKFTSTGEIALRVDQLSRPESAAVIRFSVADTGIGISESRFEAIFENFSQESPSIASNYGGTGLGLAISKRLVKLMGGDLHVQSQVGVGSTFSFTLPVVTGQTHVAAPSPRSCALPNSCFEDGTLWSGKKILVVDDVEDNRFVVSSYLKQTGLRLDEAVNGQEAFERAKDGAYDLILMDMRMSPVDGYTAVEMIRSYELDRRLRPTPVIALTAHVLKEDIHRAHAAGCNLHLIKPVTKSKLYAAIHEVFGGGPLVIRPNPDAFLKPRLATYLENRRADLVRIREALSLEDFNTLAGVGHTISGTAGIYGLDDFGRLAHELEMTAKSGNRRKAALICAQMTEYLSKVSLD